MKAIFVLALTVFFQFASMLGNNAVTVQSQQDRKLDERHTAEFRYIITSNDVGGYDNPERSVVVLLDESAFSVENLEKLFRFISKRFPEPERLEMWVNTSLWQFLTPEELDAGLVSEQGDDPHGDKHPSAYMFRRGGNEVIRHTPYPASKYTNMKTIILKGKDPQARLKS